MNQPTKNPVYDFSGAGMIAAYPDPMPKADLCAARQQAVELLSAMEPSKSVLATVFELAMGKRDTEPHYFLDCVQPLLEAGALLAGEIDRHRKLFQAACNFVTLGDFGFHVFDELDAYELNRHPWVRHTPQSFLREHFGENYDKLKNDYALRLEEMGAPDGRARNE